MGVRSSPPAPEIMLKLIRYWLPVTLWAGFIFFFSDQPGLSSGLSCPYDFILRKGAHIVVFTILFILLIRAFKNYCYSPRKSLLYSLILTILFAISDEYHQTFVPERTGTPWDVAIDSLGVVFLTLKQNRIRSLFGRREIKGNPSLTS